MVYFKYSDLIPRRFTHRIRENKKPYTNIELEILSEPKPRQGGGTIAKGVSIYMNDVDLELPRKKFLELFIKPALYALEQRIVNG